MIERPKGHQPRSERPNFSSGGLALIAIGILFCALALLCGCAGPSKARLQVLLGECREANRERVRIIHEYERANCGTNPEQSFGTINFGEAGQ